jgi:2-hydroxy-3-keto-5-methylthiopentenyl-1-phosphate phosphatase
MEGVVIVFDFDETIIDCDSDIWVADDLGVANFFNDLIKSCMPWNAAAVTTISKILDTFYYSLSY